MRRCRRFISQAKSGFGELRTSLRLPGTRAEAKFLRLAGTSNDFFGLMAYIDGSEK